MSRPGPVARVPEARSRAEFDSSWAPSRVSSSWRRLGITPGLVGMFTVLVAENLDAEAPLHERFLRRYRDACAIIGSGIKRGQRSGRFRGDIDPRVKAKEVVAFLYGIETSWLLDPAVPVAGVFAESTRSLVTALQPFPPNAPPDSLLLERRRRASKHRHQTDPAQP